MNPMRVLIADDEAVARKGLRTLLAREPDVDHRRRGRRRRGDRAAAPRADVDVLILDIQMPQKSGLDVVAGIEPARCRW